MFGSSLLVSIPGSQIAPLALPGSVFAWRHLRDALLTPDLRLALLLVMQAAAARRTKVRFVARPEIFTHGRARAWLDERLGDVEDHLALTDGETLRILPGLRNHMFFYARGMPVPEAALRRLLAVAPEAFAGLASQINGTVAVRLDGRWTRPPAHGLGFAVTPSPEPARLAPFLSHPGNPDKAAALCAEAAADLAEAPAPDGPVHYIPLSGSALGDRAMLDLLMRLLPRAALGAEPQPVLLGLPAPDSADTPLENRIALVLRALAAAGMPFSRVDFSRIERWCVRFVTAPPSAEALRGGTITLHPAVPFWRLGVDLFAAAGQVEVIGDGWLAPFRALLEEWLGPDVPITRALRAGKGIGAML